MLDKKELIDQIYDTLMQNIGFSINHVPFDLDRVTNQEVDAEKGTIHFEIDGIKVYKLKITDGDPDFFGTWITRKEKDDNADIE